MKKYFFISGLPRSGSTLLSAVLRQNPVIEAGMTSPVASLFGSLIASVSAGSEMATMVNRKKREKLFRAMVDAYYEETDSSVIFDTNRSWTLHVHALEKIFPDFRVICMVRDIPWILDSFERQYQNDPFENTLLFANAASRHTVYTRVESLISSTGIVGGAWQSLRQACFSSLSNRLIIINYDNFIGKPEKTLRELYRILDLDYFRHNFNRVEYDAPKFDEQLGISGMHKVHPVVEPRPRKSILPPDLFARYGGMMFWKSLEGSEAITLF